LTLSTDFPEAPILPSEWISQAEAAQLRGVSRQAISKLVRQGRLSSIVVGGHTLVSRTEVLAFQRRTAGRRKDRPAE
jgi:excisionase family DNA binding protein